MTCRRSTATPNTAPASSGWTGEALRPASRPDHVARPVRVLRPETAGPGPAQPPVAGRVRRTQAGPEDRSRAVTDRDVAAAEFERVRRLFGLKREYLPLIAVYL